MEAANVPLEEYKDRLSEFLKRNPASEVQEIDYGDRKHAAVTKPWGDESLAIILDDGNEKTFDALNNVYLPERFSALWHQDEEALEFIWTVFPIKSEMRERSFTFSFEGTDYECYFGLASDRLLALGSSARLLRVSKTDHRNLSQFAFLHPPSDDDHASYEPRSFWAKPVKWSEDAVLRLVNHLNFYMSYYDMGSPLILLHTPKSEERAAQPRTRYIQGEFPKQIDGRVLDDNILHFWHASLRGDPASRFIYFYRIIEYTSFSYLDARTRASIRRILASLTVSRRL
jgi:hypothetical protein